MHINISIICLLIFFNACLSHASEATIVNSKLPFNFEGNDIKIENVIVASSAHGPGRNLIPLTKKMLLNPNMTVNEAIEILGPGFVSKLSGTGGVTWYFTDGSSVGYSLWTKLNNIPKWKNI